MMLSNGYIFWHWFRKFWKQERRFAIYKSFVKVGLTIIYNSLRKNRRTKIEKKVIIQLAGFKYSPNRSAANNFANYWGVDYKYYTHSVFSQNVKKGDFITYDKAADGDWDHIGYVTAVKKSFNQKLGYKNYKVAQHTKNYNAWVSSSKNGWEKIKKEI